jgi:hypothetical protein
LDKARGVTWWRGDALWQVFANPQMTSMNFGFLAHFPFLLSVATVGTLFWEIYFAALIWLKWARYPMLALGAGLHLGIAFAMTIPSFGFLMIFAYAVFLKPEHAESIFRRLRAVAFFPQFFRKKAQVGRSGSEEWVV